MSRLRKVNQSFFIRTDVVQISRELLGKHLFTNLNNEGITGGQIVETEAYAGVGDKASHAFTYGRSEQTDVMYKQGGVAYVFLCYGIHHLFNIVTNQAGIPDAILIRAIEPIEGVELMMKRRKKGEMDRTLTGGPAALSEALGIRTQHSGMSVTSRQIWLEDTSYQIGNDHIIVSPRVGVAYAGEDAHRPWRFRIKDNPWTSPAK